MGVELSFLGQRFTITSERQQILDLLISSFEDLIMTKFQLRYREIELAEARNALEEALQKAGLLLDTAATPPPARSGPRTQTGSRSSP